ncbi:Ankyrin-2 [Fusarium oxysporum f. sp. albedinis]|nr:Ankyrin-2 [Fusarium oxysporum f. sp. albedinis]
MERQSSLPVLDDMMLPHEVPCVEPPELSNVGALCGSWANFTCCRKQWLTMASRPTVRQQWHQASASPKLSDWIPSLPILSLEAKSRLYLL